MTTFGELTPDATPIPCALCGGNETRMLYVKTGYAIGECTRCGLIYANPRAPELKILNRYSSNYFFNEYLPSLGVTAGETFDLKHFDSRYGVVLKMLAAETPPGQRRLLEVGCGAGFFLKAAERAGWQAEGIELSEDAARFATEQLHLTIRRDRAETAPIEAGSFDVAGMFDVIEHLFDPVGVVTAIARALRPGGTIVITTPNIESASRYLLGPSWAVLSPLEHVYYFSEDSLRRLLEATGFSEVRFVRTHIMWGPQETINFRYSHAPDGARAKATEALVRVGGWPLAYAFQLAGRQDSLLCFAKRA